MLVPRASASAEVDHAAPSESRATSASATTQPARHAVQRAEWVACCERSRTSGDQRIHDDRLPRL